MGQFSAAAPHHLEMAEIFLVELEDRDLAALHLDLAAEYSEDELDSASSNRDTML